MVSRDRWREMRMRAIGCTAVILTLVLALDAGIGAAAPREEGARILDDAFAKAFLAGDLDALAALYAQDAVLYPPGGMAQNGRAEIRKGFEEMFAGMSVKAFQFEDPRYVTIGDISVGWSTWTMIMAPKGGGDPITTKGRATAVAKRIGGKWLYISDHASVPLPPPSPPPPPAAETPSSS
jgi:uncharacterized protein (TIGR02246 family)